MPHMIVLIIPCYNEISRLKVDKFKDELKNASNLHFVFVDDGSTDGTFDFLKANFSSQQNFTLLKNNPNLGKASAVRQGIQHALQHLETEIDWIGFWDADLSTPLSEVSQFIQFQKTFAPDAKAICGSRVYRLGAKIIRSPLRHYLGRVFATIIAHMLHIEAYDTQCGAKLFRPETARKVFAEPFISRWIFDVEILLRTNQSEIVEYPLKEWQDIPGSKVKVLREGLRVLWEIKKIRTRYLNS